MEAIRARGLLLRGHTELLSHPRALETAREAEEPEVVVVAVKSYDTAEAVKALEHWGKRALFVSLQNGLGNLEQLASGAERVLGGVTYHGVTFVGPGEVIHAGTGDTVVGPFQGTSLREAEEMAGTLRACGLSTQVSEDVPTILWAKAVVNACFNPLTGLLRARSGQLGRSESLLECCKMIVGEAVEVANAKGIRLDPTDLMDRVNAVSKATAENKSSMLQDLERGRRTEIDAINGAIVRIGAEAGLACPVNALLTQLVKAAEEAPLHSGW